MKQQIEKIDDTLIVTSVTLLAAYVVLYSSNNVDSGLFFNVAAISSVILLALCLLLTLYGKYRTSLRKNIFDDQIDKWSKDLDTGLDKMVEDFVTPQLLRLAKTTLNKKENKEFLDVSSERLKSILNDEFKTWLQEDFDFPKKIFAENQILKIQKILNDSFMGPLKEKNAIIKYQLENFANKRYVLFIFGLISFVISIGFKLFYKG